MESTRSRLACIGVIAAAVALFVVLRAPFLSLPLERDEGEYAYIAQQIAEGGVPYRDVFDQKPPGVFVAYLAAFAVFGESIEGIHRFLYLWTAVTAALLFALVAQLAGPLAAAFSVLVFAMTSADPRILATAANAEMFMLLPLVASVWCLVAALDRDRVSWWMACGAMAAWACWFKHVAIANVVFVCIAAVVAKARSGESGWWLAALRRLLWIGTGGALVSAPVLLYFAAAGAWAPFVDALFLHNFEYAQSVSFSSGLTVLGRRLAFQAPSFAVFWLLAAIALFCPSLAGRRSWWLLLGFAMASALGVSLGAHYRPHYFVQFLPALAGLCGVSLGVVTSWLLRRSAAAAVAGLAALFVGIIAPPVWANRAELWAKSETEISRRMYWINPFPESLTIARFIRENSEPDDEIYVVGSEPQIFFYAKRTSATRYIYFYPLTGDFPDAAQRQRELIVQVATRKPLYVVWVDISMSIAHGEVAEKLVLQTSADWIREHYQLEVFAQPGGELAEFDFLYGSAAREALSALREREESIPWVAVFRRAR